MCVFGGEGQNCYSYITRVPFCQFPDMSCSKMEQKNANTNDCLVTMSKQTSLISSSYGNRQTGRKSVDYGSKSLARDSHSLFILHNPFTSPDV